MRTKRFRQTTATGYEEWASELTAKDRHQLGIAAPAYANPATSARANK